MFGKLAKVLMIVEGESRVVKVLERRIEALEKREGKLLDRLMARTYGEFVLGQDVAKEETPVEKNYSEDSLAENAGEILETE